MTHDDWHAPGSRTLAMYLNGRAIRRRGPQGEPVVDDSYLAIFHGGGEAVTFTLPGQPWASGYDVVFDTAAEDAASPVIAGARIEVTGQSAVLLRALRRNSDANEDPPG